MAVFAGGRWLRYLMQYVEFATTHIPEVHIQWLIDIVIYLQFVTGDTVSVAELQRDEVHTEKVMKTKE